MQEYLEFIKANMVLSLVWVILVVVIVMNFIKAKMAKYKAVTPLEVTHLINKEDGVVVDIRSGDEFKQGHITGSINVLESEIKSGSVPNLEKYKNSPIIVVCKSGMTAQGSSSELVKAGFEKVYLLKGGILSWTEAKMPLVRGKK